jgi:protein-S-isoprenylcysteine O-methyltransferase Ste14
MRSGTRNLVNGVARVALVLVAIVVAGIVIDALLGVSRVMSVDLNLVGSLLLGGGLALEALGTWAFLKFGRGTPNPIDPPRSLVMDGPYRYSRNPLYLARLLILFGFAGILRSPGIALLASGLLFVLQFLLIPGEEARLVKRYNGAYDDYRMRVPRWIPVRLVNRRKNGS